MRWTHPKPLGATLGFMGEGTLSVPSWELQPGRGHLSRTEQGRGDRSLVPGDCGTALVRVDLDPAGAVCQMW